MVCLISIYDLYCYQQIMCLTTKNMWFCRWKGSTGRTVLSATRNLNPQQFSLKPGQPNKRSKSLRTIFLRIVKYRYRPSRMPGFSNFGRLLLLLPIAVVASASFVRKIKLSRSMKYGDLNIFVQLIFSGLDIHLVHPGRHLHHLLLQEKIFTLAPAASQGLPRDSAGRWCLRYLYGQTPPGAGHQVERAVAHP